MKNLTIESEEFYNLCQCYRWWPVDAAKPFNALIEHIDARLAEAYEQGKKDATTWQPIEAATRPMPVVYLVMNNKGQVAPSIDGVIHNTIGTAWDWAYGELITHFMLMPLPKEPT